MGRVSNWSTFSKSTAIIVNNISLEQTLSLIEPLIMGPIGGGASVYLCIVYVVQCATVHVSRRNFFVHSIVLAQISKS